MGAWVVWSRELGLVGSDHQDLCTASLLWQFQRKAGFFGLQERSGGLLLKGLLSFSHVLAFGFERGIKLYGRSEVCIVWEF